MIYIYIYIMLNRNKIQLTMKSKYSRSCGLKFLTRFEIRVMLAGFVDWLVVPACQHCLYNSWS